MKTPRYLQILIAVLFFAGLGLVASMTMTGCSSPPSARVVQVQSLKAVGQAAEAAVQLSAQLYQAHTITAAQARQVLDFYNDKFQPAYRVSVYAINANLDSLASPELQSLAIQISSLVQSFIPPPK